MIKKRNLIISLSAAAALNFFNISYSAAENNPPDSTKYYVKKVADWQWQELETKGWKKPQYDWTNSVLYVGTLAWERATGDKDYEQKLINVGEHEKWKLGAKRYFADEYCIG